MIMVLSGEGPTDIGTCANALGECSGDDFRPGPMAVVIDKLAELIAGYSLLAAGALEFISEGNIARASKQLPMALSAGKKRDYETAFFFKGARALARHASRRGAAANCPAGAVLFRDADGTRSTERGLYEAKWNSIEGGFRAENFENGVPMVPKPKSEAWLICALKPQPYQNCAALEDSLSGNDNSPNPAKTQLEALLDLLDKSSADLPDLVGDGAISATRIDMPSFQRFRQRLEEVTRNMLGQPQP
jgi:hypothetical protein